VIDGSACQEIGFSSTTSPLHLPLINNPLPKTPQPHLFYHIRPTARLLAHSIPSSTTTCSVSTPALRHFPSAPQTGLQFAHSAPSTSARHWHRDGVLSSSNSVERIRHRQRQDWLCDKVGRVAAPQSAQAAPPRAIRCWAHSDAACACDVVASRAATCTCILAGGLRGDVITIAFARTSHRSKAHIEGLAGSTIATFQIHPLCAPTQRWILLTLPRNRSNLKMGYEDSVYLAKLAEQAERYEGKPVSSEL
jgi:hypothetical protein